MADRHVFRWMLDVQPLWPYPGDRGKRILTKQQWASVQTSLTALTLLPLDEQENVLRYHFASDAKLCLASCLLKRKAISEVCRVPQPEIAIGQDIHKKPCYKPEDPMGKTLEFNVSHHGSLVALVGCSGKGTQLGVDIVKMDFEKDYAKVVEMGFQNWARTYETIFSDREMNDIAQFTYELPSGDPQETVRAKLRHFSAHWCLKEAYVKMTGEALLASWLKELEFRNVQVPISPAQLGWRENDWGQTCTVAEIWFRGKQLTDITLEIQAFREDYMIATAASSPLVPFSAFKELDFERDIWSKAV